MRTILMMMLGALLWTASSAGVTPSYLWGEFEFPAGVLEGLASRIQTESIPLAKWGAGELEFSGAADELELESSPAFAYVDGDVLFVAVQSGSIKAVLRGRYPQAEIVAMAEETPLALPEGFLELVESLGLLPADCSVEFELREVPLKLPRAPDDVRLDSVLWALVNHPDWLEFARNHGLQRVGLRIRVVVELSGELDASFEPFIQSSTPTLAELLIPIPYLPELGADPAARFVRPPHTPYPAEG